ncbi:kinase-like domain-containing protein [Nemania abortiva]|nr:kinase-like domain-containing protein [Nemania abortiva]
MIKPEERFISNGQCYCGTWDNPETRTYCNVWDWDQLRMIKVKGTAKLFRPDEDVEVPILARFADYLSPEVRSVTVDDDGLITQVSTDPEEDDTPFMGYHPFSTVESLHDCQTIRYSKIQELGRLGPGVDLSLYYDEFQDAQKVAFKFSAFGKQRRLLMAWDELHLYKSLPQHPNIVSFDQVVLEDTESRVIGFTTKYITGGTFDNPNRPFRFEYLQQLTRLVDFLNLDLGIMHQDIAPRNLLIDPQTQKLLLFDFDFVAHGEKGLLDGRDDVIGVALTLYELITGDKQFEIIPHRDRNIDMVQDIPEWPRKRELDSDVSTFRNFLNEWIATRTGGNDMQRYLNAPNRLTWPDPPNTADFDAPPETPKTHRAKYGEAYWGAGGELRRDAVETGKYVFRWERPPQSRLRKPKRLRDSE